MLKMRLPPHIQVTSLKHDQPGAVMFVYCPICKHTVEVHLFAEIVEIPREACFESAMTVMTSLIRNGVFRQHH